MSRSHLASPAPQHHTAAACCLVAGRWVPGQVAAGRRSCPGLLHKQQTLQVGELPAGAPFWQQQRVGWLQWCRAATACKLADAQASMIGRQEATDSAYLQSGAGDGGPGQPREGMQGRRHKPLRPRRTRRPVGPASEDPGEHVPGLQQTCGGPAAAAAAGAGAGAAGLPSVPACARPAGSGATQSCRASVSSCWWSAELAGNQAQNQSVCAAAAADVCPAGRQITC